MHRFISGYRTFRDKRGLELALDEFFRKFPVLYQENKNVRWHFRPQSDFFPDMALARFGRVFDFERFDLIKAELERTSGTALPDSHHQQSRFSDFEVMEWQAEQIAEFYRCDYEAGFGIPERRREDLDG